MNAAFVLVAAGAGKRLGSSQPKAFVDLAGKTLLVRSLEALLAEPRFEAGSVVVPADRCEEARRLIGASLSPRVDVVVVAGGAERSQSVYAGLLALSRACDVVVVHDAARPFVQSSLVAACIDAAVQHGAATAVVAATDTIKEVGESGIVVRTLDRSRLRLVQTPQAFRREILLAAHQRALRDSVSATDDASLIEQGGGKVWAVPGDPANVKITTSEDLAWGRWRLEREPR